MKKRRAFTMVEVMTVMFIMSIMFAIVSPQIAYARGRFRARACGSNLRAIQGAKEMWAIESMQSSSATPTWTDLVGPGKYLKSQPACPSRGTYRMRRVRSTTRCSVGGVVEDPLAHVLP